jgi:hypothetical protein
MILFVNVFITRNFATPYDRGRWSSQDRIDTFKYAMASMAVIPFSKVFIYAQLDECYMSRSGEINEYLVKLFGDKLVHRHFRIDKQFKWQAAMEEVFVEKDELIWFTCNDDHVFMDYDLDVFNSIETKMKSMLETNKYIASYISHWPEMLCHANYGRQYPILDRSREFFEVDWVNIDSIQVVSREVLRHWWFAHDYGNKFLIRTDGNMPGRGPDYIHIHQDLSLRTLIPLREIARHFDGYSRPYIAGGSADINRCTPLFVPAGFFHDHIKISFCKEKRIDDHVHVHPCLTNYSTVDPNGADCKWMLEDIPLFWRDKIAHIEFGPEIDRSTLIHARNKAVRDVANSERAFLSVSKPVDMSWLEVAYR